MIGTLLNIMQDKNFKIHLKEKFKAPSELARAETSARKERSMKNATGIGIQQNPSPLPFLALVWKMHLKLEGILRHARSGPSGGSGSP